MPMYVKQNGKLVRISKAAEAQGIQTIRAALQPDRSFTDAAADLLGDLADEYDGDASGTDGDVLLSDAKAWLAARNGQEE